MTAPHDDAQGRGASPHDELSNYFNEHGTHAAPTYEIIDSDAATRVSSAAQIFQSGNASYGPPPNAWSAEHDGQTFTSDQLQGLLPTTEYTGDPYNQGVANPYGYNDPYAQVPPAPAPEYGLAVAGSQQAPAWGAADGGYSQIRVNGAEHLGPFSQDLVMMSHPDGFAASQFRTLRYRLEQEPDLQVIVVTSAREGDGKSVTAANLALALAEGGRIQVLLIDASLRNPALHTLFGIRGDIGLTSVLAARQGDPSMPIDVIRITASLSLIPAGPPVASAHAALSSEAAAVLMGHIRREFRYIIIDSAPVFGTAETLAWHGLIDKYIVVSRAGVTTTEDLTAACDRLQRERIVGVTFVGGKVKRK